MSETKREEVINDLDVKIMKLRSTLQKLQEQKGAIFSNLQSILRENKLIKNQYERNKEVNYESIKKALDTIDEKAKAIEMLFTNPQEVDESEYPVRDYKVNLRKILNFGILTIEAEDFSVTATFKGKLFEIINTLVKKYIDDIGTSVPVEFRGYVRRKELEKKLYGKYIGRNRLNSHITRIRTILLKDGLTDTEFIRSQDDYVRINIDSDDVTITE